MNDRTLRQHLRDLLTKTNAHLMFDETVEDFPPAHRGIRPDNAPHSAWELLEHLRIAQYDILEFSRSADYQSPAWPEGYWPEQQAPPNAASWAESTAKFKADLTAFVDLIINDSNDLFEPIPYGNGQTLLREALVLAKHNSYHLGQLVQLKRMLGEKA